MSTVTTNYVCRFCRQPSDPSGVSCPNCGAPIDVKEVRSESGWQEQPAIKDMARIQFGQSSAQIEGTQVPVVDFKLTPPNSIYFSHHTLLWAEPSVSLGTMPMAGGWNRTLAGLPLVMMQASGSGHVALSDDHPGEVIAVPMQAGQAMHVREHRFLTATDAVQYTWTPSNIWFNTGTGDDRKTHYPLGMNLDVFHAPSAPGLLLLHSPGNSFIRDLAPGEHICIQPTALLYKDLSVQMSLHLEYPNTAGASFFTSSYSLRTVWLRLIGPGRVAMQSVFERPEGSEPITGSSGGTTHQRW
jgi:uncharacterized protein (AIM24 family)